VKLFVRNLNVTGNATNPIALNQNASLFAKILTAFLKLTAALVKEDQELLLPSPSLRKLRQTNNAVDVELSEKVKELLLRPLNSSE
jgi:hypothetical protein